MKAFHVVMCAGLLLFGGRAACRASDVSAVKITADTPWVVSTNEPEAIQRALENVSADWYQVLGHRPVIVPEPPKSWTGPVVYLGTQGAWLKEMINAPAASPESYVLRLQKDAVGRPAIVATGADLRGGIYAAYALSEELLGVDPWTIPQCSMAAPIS